MANDEAWQAGVDIAQKKKSKSQSKAGDPQKKEGWGKRFLHALSPISNLHKGGTVKKTGEYRLKKGERVLTGPQQKRAGLKKSGKKKAGKKRVARKA
jgi:hypothetical protein